jgi:hypothetical protein
MVGERSFALPLAFLPDGINKTGVAEVVCPLRRNIKEKMTE